MHVAYLPKGPWDVRASAYVKGDDQSSPFALLNFPLRQPGTNLLLDVRNAFQSRPESDSFQVCDLSKRSHILQPLDKNTSPLLPVHVRGVFVYFLHSRAEVFNSPIFHSLNIYFVSMQQLVKHNHPPSTGTRCGIFNVETTPGNGCHKQQTMISTQRCSPRRSKTPKNICI